MNLSEFLDAGLWSRVGMALLCGGLIGLERQLRGKPAGMRTSSLICIGTMMFVYLGLGLTAEEGGGGDSTRVLGQVVTGVGFLGAGVIMTRNGLVTGVTSAAVVWVLAAVGAAVGAGRFGASLAISIVTVAILVGVEQLERVFSALRRGVHANIELAMREEEEERTMRPRRGHRSSGAPPFRRNRE